MKWFAGTLPLLALLLFGRPAVAQDEATIKGAFIMCGLQHVLIACDDLVKMPDLNNVVRSNAYGARAGVLVGLGRMDDAKRDLGHGAEARSRQHAGGALQDHVARRRS